ncbi:5812_t:CDS:2 [Ambispora gerdemannii]|uniref:5812_t:CDS:1 n=1 Tax=Ambispora gerdemannii TaxID=144530 RepID=A0A9N9DUW2_9GLOM|nr:5812_t:CDS:2 [Ambispora gerdemannii]
MYENVKYRFSHLPNTLQLCICQINERAMTFSDPIGVKVTGLNEETGEIMLNCQRENVKFRTEPRKKVLRDGKHSILVEKNFEIKYELVRSSDVIRTKKNLLKRVAFFCHLLCRQC